LKIKISSTYTYFCVQ